MPVTERCPWCGQASLFVHLPAENAHLGLLPGLWIMNTVAVIIHV